MLRLATSDAVVAWPLVAWLAVAGAAVSGIPTPGRFREQTLGAAAGALATAAMFGAIYLIWFLLLRHLTKVRVHDNRSVGPQLGTSKETRSTGLGTAQLEACTLSWRRTYDPQRGTTLVARLPTLG